MRGVKRGSRIRVWIEVHAIRRSDPTPVPGEQGAAEQIGPDNEAIEAPLIAIGLDASEGSLVGEQRQLNRLGQSACSSRLGVISREVYHQPMLKPAETPRSPSTSAVSAQNLIQY